MNTGRWKFRVEGTFCSEGRPVSPCEAIIESGDRSDASPFKFRGVGPIAKSDENGRFRSWYVTDGSSEFIMKPDTVSVYIRVAKGAWEPIVVSIDANAASVQSDTEMEIDLGSVEIPAGMKLYAQDACSVPSEGTQMDKMATLAKLLQLASILIGRTAREIATIPFEPKAKNMETVIQALSAVSDLQRAVAKDWPDLAPVHLRPQPEPSPQDRVYSPNNPMPPEIVKVYDIQIAIEILECFAAADINLELTRIASEQLPALREMLETHLPAAEEAYDKG